MKFNFLMMLLVGLFAAVDFLVVHFTAPLKAPTSMMASVYLFFVNVNVMLKGLIDSIFDEVESNWHEFALLGLIYFLLFGLDLPIVFVYVLVGYLATRLIADIFKR